MNTSLPPDHSDILFEHRGPTGLGRLRIVDGAGRPVGGYLSRKRKKALSELQRGRETARLLWNAAMENEKYLAGDPAGLRGVSTPGGIERCGHMAITDRQIVLHTVRGWFCRITGCRYVDENREPINWCHYCTKDKPA